MLNLVIVMISVNFIRKHIDIKSLHPKWDFVLDKLRFIAPFIFLLSQTNDKFEPTFDFVWFVVFSIIIYVLWLSKENRIAQILIWAAVPFLVINSINDFILFLAPKFHNKNSDHFELVWNCGLLWMLAFGIGANYQRRALIKEEAKTKVILTQKEELEILVNERTAEILKQKEELEKALEELKATQAQLVHQEKLASLGELTAGIAHEIQNPLNFVNNFSELSIELIEEIAPPAPDGGANQNWFSENAPYGGWGAFFGDLAQNLEKINHHGKRASNIVKGMLQHSRASSGTKELTDINKLADEYLRLSYHGLRAKDKSFNANFELIADPNLPKVNVIPQDIGRVLLNLINNAFQSPCPQTPEGGLIQKKVIVKTFLIEANNNSPLGGQGGLAVITISDNGSGIPTDILPKIFQPFFTTKPTGQGTGLGLSLAYDIVTKGHGGTIEVESVEDEGTTFTVKLPI